MVINENTKSVDVTEVLLILGPSVSNISHALAVHEDILDSIVHRVVEEGIDVVLVVAYIPIEAIEALTHLEDSSRLCILLPEVLGYLRDSIDADTIKVVLLNKILDPGFQVAAHVLITLIEIWEAGKATVFDLPLVAPVVDVAVSMIVLRLVEGVDL